MPTYQYACTECGHRFEQVQSFSEDALTSCPQCEGRLRKLFNAVGVVFKGSGFYRNDSRAETGSGPKASGESGGSSSDTSSSDAGKAGEKKGDKSGDKAGDKVGTTSDTTSGSKGTGTTKKSASSGSSSTATGS